MKYLFGCLVTALFCSVLAVSTYAFSSSLSGNNTGGEGKPPVNVVPEPVLLKINTGKLQLKADLTIHVPSAQSELLHTGELLGQYIAGSYGIKPALKVNASPRSGDISLSLLKEENPVLGIEGYILDINNRNISIKANKAAGLFYGIQTLRQLMNDADGDLRTSGIALPRVYIEDYPRFRYRGMLLDVAHHFPGKDCVKEFIDQMAMFKYNRLQLHMTNDNGWRIEIKQYPRLTEVGAWHVAREGAYYTYDHLPPLPGEACTAGGFFTQEDIREIVSYASERFVEIIPGIELPGHALALIASYPEVSCTGQQYDVNPGIRRNYDKVCHEICAGREENFKMLENILDEYMALFPSEYVHIGGDEADKGFWKKCHLCRKRMADEKLANVEELQSYFIHRIEKYLNSKGKKLLGWDEILDGGLAPNATVMSWRDITGGVKAAKMGHDVVMTPNTFVYFDHRQTDSAILPHVTRWHYLPLSKVYTFEPVPEGVDSKYVLGGQGCLWSEYICTCDENAYQAWPRGIALSEVLWSPKANRSLDRFHQKLEYRFSHLDRLKIRYSTAIYDPVVTSERNKKDVLEIRLDTEVKGLDIHYTFNDHIPTTTARKYDSQPIPVPKGASRMMAAAFRNGRQMGSILDLRIEDLAKRAGNGRK